MSRYRSYRDACWRTYARRPFAKRWDYVKRVMEGYGGGWGGGRGSRRRREMRERTAAMTDRAPPLTQLIFFSLLPSTPVPPSFLPHPSFLFYLYICICSYGCRISLFLYSSYSLPPRVLILALFYYFWFYFIYLLCVFVFFLFRSSITPPSPISSIFN